MKDDLVERLKHRTLCEQANEYPDDDLVAMLSAAAARIASLEAEVARKDAALRDLIGALDHLIAESGGVYGLHLNGDPAPWSELTEGGRFEEWLLPLETARAALGDKTDD